MYSASDIALKPRILILIVENIKNIYAGRFGCLVGFIVTYIILIMQ